MKAPSSFSSVRTARLLLGAGTLAAAALALAGCSILPAPVEDPTRYYLLNSDTEATVASLGGPSAQADGLRLALRAVELPGYLRNNRTVVVRNGVNEIRYQDYARWAEPLDTAVQRVVRERLLSSPQVASAEVAPFSPELRREWDINIRVLHCEGGVDAQGRKTARFAAVYEIADATGEGDVRVRKRFEAPASAWDGSDFAALTQKLSEAAEALADDILATAASLSKKAE